MARSRIGGSSGKLSGKVGDVIYSITRNPDGTFRQQISANPAERVNPNTDAQARARLTMATIERAMFTFRDFMGTGFEGVERGTLSVSEFSKVNYNAIKEQIEFWWDDPEGWEDQFNLPKKGQGQPRAGCYILGRGSLHTPFGWRLSFGGLNSPWFLLMTHDSVSGLTLQAWLARNSMKIGDQRVHIIFEEGLTPSKAAVIYIIVATKPTANPNTIITSSNFRNLLQLSSNVPLNVVFNNTTSELSFEFTRGDSFGLKCVSMDATRLRREVNGKILYNNCELIPIGIYTPEDYGWQNLSNVKSSWLI